MPIMATMGNNDLLDKKHGQCFANFFTNENQWANSVYHFMVGNVEFICLNSNTDYDFISGVGTLGTGETNKQYQNTDEFLLDQAKWLDDYLTNRTTNPTWTIVYMHLSPFTCVRTKRVQVFTPVFEKHSDKIPLVLCGHNHLYTKSIPVYTGMPMPNTVEEYQSYNEYYNFTKKQTIAYVDESQLPNASGGVGINHNPDIQKGVYYVQCPSTGWKTSGKETHITTFSDEAVEGYDYNVNGKTDGRVWWSDTHDKTKLAGYLTISITEDKIHLKFYQITGAKGTRIYNGKSYEYTPDNPTMSRTLIDELIINKSDRI